MQCYRLIHIFIATIFLAVLGTQAKESNVLLGSHVYLVSDQKINWFAAADYCTTKGMRMLTIESADEHERFVKHLKSTPQRGNDVWTAGNELGALDHWMWRTTGKRINYTNWGTGEPNHFELDEHCIELQYKIDYYWNDIHCMDVNLAACEVRVSSTKDKYEIVDRQTFTVA